MAGVRGAFVCVHRHCEKRADVVVVVVIVVEVYSTYFAACDASSHRGRTDGRFTRWIDRVSLRGVTNIESTKRTRTPDKRAFEFKNSAANETIL